ncbi:two-component sensor histidine kinase [Streptomyces ferrugineus]|uniref:histidine kinase n=1 Tax=Streptomyces ferrugineus TaxID=1413221 RepID=A0A7M2SMI1_9ACTN|nr:histidine kinase [Streptomyces ferrugineus]QOV36683.1 two-component sensor histidine kinase [Streptomyces ferrugineus]
MDAFVAAVVFGISLLAPVLDNNSDTRPLTLQGALYAAVICASLTLRRRWPSAVLAVTASGTASGFAVTGHKSSLMLATMIAMCTCALHLPRRRAVLEVAAAAALLAGTSVVFGHRGWTGPEVVALSALSASAAAVGFAVRNRRAYVAAVEERARRAEQTREEEARRRVIDERLRIARELHDVLAHHIALINVQAAVVDHVMETEPVQARESLAHIRRAARSSLEEVRTTLGLLRRPDAPNEVAVEPSPGLHQLPDLIASFTAAGLIVDQKIAGTPVDLPPAVSLTAYRVVQEALTNASRHASRPHAELELDYLPSALQISVRNPAEATSRSRSSAGPDPLALGEGGHGLLGMRERAHALGGTFATRMTDGHFEVRVLLPHERTGT